MGNPPSRFVSRVTSCFRISVMGVRSTETVTGVVGLVEPFVEVDPAAVFIATADTLT